MATRDGQHEWEVTQRRRVLALLQKHPLDMPRHSLKRWAVYKLLAWQPLARRIRFEGRCHCKGAFLMSYTLASDTYTPNDLRLERCGFYCPSCGFGNAGKRDRYVKSLWRGRV